MGTDGKNIYFLPPVLKHFSFIKERGSTIARSQIVSIVMDKSSHPCAFSESREQISNKTFDLSILTLDRILSHFGVYAGIELSSESKENFCKEFIKDVCFGLVIGYENAIF